MGFKVILSARSIRDLESIVLYIASDNPQEAKRVGLQLIEEAEAIGPHPWAGRVVPEFRNPLIRERIFRSYRIVYRVEEDHRRIIVSRFWHAARGIPELGT
jgi:plasmid stabilization system protein ParE